MSWDPYVDQLISSGLHHCCIAGHDGHVWGSSAGFKISAKEIVSLCQALSDDSAARKRMQQKGLTVCGMPYALNRVEDAEDDIRYIVARCKKQGKPARGAIVARTPKTVIVGVHDPVYSEGESFGKAKVAISLLADSLFAMNF